MVIALIGIILPFHSYAGDTRLIEADSAYNKGDYEHAVELYKLTADSVGTSAEMLYNMGNAYYKAGDDGHAMISYLRAKRLDPRNSRINDNIRFLASRIEDANKAELKGKKGNVSPDPLSFFQRVGHTITVDTASDYWAVFAAMAFIIMLATIAVYIFSRPVNIKKIGFFSAIIMFIFTVIFTIFALCAAHVCDRHDDVVMTAFKTNLLEEPDANARIIGTPLHRGTVFKILDEEGDIDGKPVWYKVKLNNDNIGWIPAIDVEII